MGLPQAFALFVQLLQGPVGLGLVLTREAKTVTAPTGDVGVQVEKVASAIAARAAEVGAHATEHGPLQVRQANRAVLPDSNQAQHDGSLAGCDLAIALETADIDAGRLLDQGTPDGARRLGHGC